MTPSPTVIAPPPAPRAIRRTRSRGSGARSRSAIPGRARPTHAYEAHDGPVDAMVDAVDDPGADTDRVDIPARLGRVRDVDVVIGMQHVVEDSLQRLGERCRGVLHAGRLQHAATSPVLGTPARGHEPHRTRVPPQRPRWRRRAMPAAIKTGDMTLLIPARWSSTMPRSSGRTRTAVRRRPRGQARNRRFPGTSPSARHAAASNPIPISIGAGDSTACSAAGGSRQRQDSGPDRLHERGGGEPGRERDGRDRDRHRQPEHRRRVAPAARTSTWNSAHSLTKPLNGGSAMMAKPPIAKNAAVTGMRRARPPSWSRSRVPVARTIEPAARNSNALNNAWFNTNSKAATSATPASDRFVLRGQEHRRADADEDEPDVLGRRVREQHLQVGARPARAGCRTAPTRRPSTSTRSPHQRGPPPSRSIPTSTMP